MAKILIADDDVASCEVVGVAVEAEGHEVVYAADGREAYEMALARQPDFIFLDVMMPIYDGYETCRMLRDDPSLAATLPIVFLTSADVDKRKIESVGGTDYLPKQHRIDELRDILVKYLGY